MSTHSLAATRFAAAVVARHPLGQPGARAARDVRTSTRVHRRDRARVVHAGVSRFTFAPHVHVAVQVAGRWEGAPRSVIAPSTTSIGARTMARAVRDEGGASRVPHRGVRSSDGTPTAESRPSSHISVSRGVPRVLRQHAPIIVEAPDPVRRDGGSSRAATQPVRSQPLSPVEINRLTDHIVHTIDRRIAAFRERQGRV